MRRILTGIAAIICVVSPALAQQPGIVDAVPVSSDFNESYDESAPVSGAPLVGLRLGLGGSVERNAALVVGMAAFDGPLCLRVTTKDGRFSASNAYRIVEDPLDSLVRVSPLTQKFAIELGGYSAGQVAIRAFNGAGETCTPANAVNLPVLDGPRSAASDMVVLANGKSMPAEVALLDDESQTALVEASCTPAADGANIAYDLVCSLSLPDDLDGRATLRLRFSDGFGSQDDYLYAVHLPPVTAP